MQMSSELYTIYTESYFYIVFARVGDTMVIRWVDILALQIKCFNSQMALIDES